MSILIILQRDRGLLDDVVEEEPAVIADVMHAPAGTQLNTDRKLDCFLT